MVNTHASSASTYQKYAAFLLVLLVASLPFFSVRHSAVAISPPLLILMIISASVMLRCLLTVELKVALTKLDIAIVVYMGVALVNLSMVANGDGAKFAFAKTVIYVGSYFCLKHMLQQLSLPQIEASAKTGVFAGTVMFLVLTIVCLVVTGQINAVTSFDYHRLTHNVFSSIGHVIGSRQNEDFEGRDIMRNSVAEAFAFYFLCTLVFKFKSRAANIFILAANVILVICTFSRRAFYGIAIVVFGGSFFDQAGVKRGIAMSLLIGSIVAGTMLLQEQPDQNRLADISGGSRIEQYSEALSQFTSLPFSGTGYGSKLEGGTYIHNFVLASAAMMGVSGLFSALYIYVSTVFQFMLGLAKPQRFNTATFLVIPILGMTVGATIEGLFTITSWLALSLYAVCSQHQGNLDQDVP